MKATLGRVKTLQRLPLGLIWCPTLVRIATTSVARNRDFAASVVLAMLAADMMRRKGLRTAALLGCAEAECGEIGGNGNACCRKDESADAPRECQGSLSFTTWHHECVVPIHSTSSELFQKRASVGAEAASKAAKKGMSPEQQAEGLSAQSAAQIAAAGAQQAAQKNDESQDRRASHGG
eukprot:Skav205082  [mRNA]  locus=scaffold142:549166:550791:- [translate_table: standard]